MAAGVSTTPKRLACRDSDAENGVSTTPKGLACREYDDKTGVSTTLKGLACRDYMVASSEFEFLGGSIEGRGSNFLLRWAEKLRSCSTLLLFL